MTQVRRSLPSLTGCEAAPDVREEQGQAGARGFPSEAAGRTGQAAKAPYQYLNLEVASASAEQAGAAVESQPTWGDYLPLVQAVGNGQWAADRKEQDGKGRKGEEGRKERQGYVPLGLVSRLPSLP